jgi:hypothetical protein
MNRILEILENHGLVSTDSVEQLVNDWPMTDVYAVRDELDSALDQAPEAPAAMTSINDPFNFVASASIRGDFGCFNWDCRLVKTRLLARYAALYTDKTVVPLPLGIFRGSEDEFGVRDFLGGTILCVQHLRPLVEAGIVEFARREFPYCRHHLHRALPAYANIEKTARKLYLENEHLFSVYGQPPEDREDDQPSFKIEGPREFLEHGTMWKITGEIPDWLKNWHLQECERKFSKSMLRRSRLVASIFDELAQDLAVEQVLGLKYDAKYLTNLSGEAMMLSRFSSQDDYFDHCREVLCEELSHAVPLLEELPLRTILKVRAQEYDAFINYRAALNSIITGYIKERKTVGKKEAKEIYADILLPEVLKLNSQARAVRRSAVKRAAAKTLIAAGVVGLGVFGGFLPTQLAEVIKTVGGIGLVRELGEAFASIERNPSEIRNHNFYFLLRLNQEAGH